MIKIGTSYIRYRDGQEKFEYFLTYTNRAVTCWERYGETHADIDYFNFICSFSAAIDFFDLYSCMQPSHSNREYLAMYTICDDMINNYPVPPCYVDLLCEELRRFDENYDYGSDYLFLKIYQIDNWLKHSEKSE